MKLELTIEEYEDLMTCTAVGVFKAREWLTTCEHDEFSRAEDVEHYANLLDRLTELDKKVRDYYGGEQK